MRYDMTGILALAAALLCVNLLGGCDRGTGETPTPEPSVDQITLVYAAGPNGTIDGEKRQVIERGGDGSPVTAVPDENHYFTGWSDGVATATRTDRDVKADLAVTAGFAVDRHALTYAAGEGGAIEGEASQQVSHGGDGLAVTAVPAEGYRFERWSDGAIENPRVDREVTADLTVTAGFVPDRYTLVYAAGPNGAIDGEKRQVIERGGDGSPVTAVPNENHYFTGWGDGVATATRTDRDVKADLAVTAGFAVDRHALTYAAGKGGSVDGPQGQQVDHGGDGLAVTAVPAEGYRFERWSDGATENPRIDRAVTADLAVTAEFALIRHTLTYVPGENGSIEGFLRQEVVHGGDGSPVMAVPDPDHRFAGWSDGVATATRQDTGVTGDLEAEALFAVNTYTVGGAVSGLADGVRLVLQNREGENLSLTGNGEFTFAGERVKGDPYEVTVLVQPTSPNQTCTVTGGTGTVFDRDVEDIRVDCVLSTYTVGGIVFGLPEGEEVVLGNSAGETLPVRADGAYVFATPFEDGSVFEVRIHRQPDKPNWTCEVENGTGALEGHDVTDVHVACYVEAVLEARAGINKVYLDWNSMDFRGATFNLCRAGEEIPADGAAGCKGLMEGVEKTGVTSPLTVSGLANDIPYWFRLEVRHGSGRRTYSNVVEAMPFGGLNDSGIDWCADDASNHEVGGNRSEKSASCLEVGASHPGQDALHGRDALARTGRLEKTGRGSAGFDFSKVCRNGDRAGEGKCPPNPSLGSKPKSWGCIRDNVTGLTWELKVAGGPQSPDHTFTWYNPDASVNGGGEGVKDGGSCQGSRCDTLGYVQAINDLGLCGRSDWRVPTRKELLSIVDNGRSRPAADSRFFPNVLSAYYWSSSPYADQPDSAWQVYFLYGGAYPEKKNQARHLRLVSGRTVTFGLDNP